MHPSRSTLIAYFDGEAGKAASRRIARHLANCAGCAVRLRQAQNERAELSAGGVPGGIIDGPQSASGLFSAIAQWRSNSAGSSILRRRIRSQIEIYFGSQTLPVVDDGAMTAEQLLVRTNELLSVFLGQAAAESVQDEAMGGLGPAWR
jgi:anti-sigma factor RsiW